MLLADTPPPTPDPAPGFTAPPWNPVSPDEELERRTWSIASVLPLPASPFKAAMEDCALSAVDLSGQALTLGEVQVLCAYAGDHNRALASLDLGGCALDSRAMDALALMLRSNRAIHTLSVARNPAAGWEGSSSLFRHLAVNPTLTALDMSRCDVGSRGARELGEMLQCNGSVSSLDLTDTRLCSDGGAKDWAGLEHLVAALRFNGGLRTLSLARCGIGGGGAGGDVGEAGGGGAGGAGGGAGGAGGAGRRLGLLLPALRQAVLMLVAVAALAAHPYLFALLAIDVVPSLPGCRALLRPLLLRLPALAALGTLAAAALLAAAAVGATLPAGSGCMGDGGAGYAKGQYSVAGCAAEAIVLGLPAAVAAPLLAASLPQPRPYLTMPEAEAGGEAEGGGGGGGGEGGGGGWLGAPLLLLLLCVAVLLLQACTRRAPAPCTHHAPAGCCRHAPTMHPYAPAMHLLRACHARSWPSSCSKLTGPRLTTLTAGRARPRARQPCGAAGGARRGAARPGAQLPRVRPVAPRAAPSRRTRLRAARRGRAQPHGIPAAARPCAGAPRATGAAAARRRPRRGAGWRGARGRRAGGRGRRVAGRVRAARCGGLLPRL